MSRFPILLYIDPGTGSMLFTIFIGIASAAVFFFKDLIIRFKARLGTKDVAKSMTEGQQDLIIFSEGKRYSNIFGPICDELEKRGVNCLYWTESEDDPVINPKYKHVKCEYIGEGNKAFARLNMLNSKVCLATTPGLDVYQWKRSKHPCHYVHIFHTVDDTLAYRMFGMDYYDSILLTGQFQEQYIRRLEKMRNLPAKRLPVVGSNLLDSLKAKYDEHMKTTSDSAKEPSDVRTVLLAPSWGESSILNRYGEKILQSLVNTGYKIIVRPHPQSEVSDPDMLRRLRKMFPDNNQVIWDSNSDNFDSLNRADIMITDFSGIIFDYTLVFDKPVIYADTSFDSAPYDAAWFDEELWRFRVLRSLGVQLKEDDFDNMKSIIDGVIEDDRYSTGRANVCKEAWEHVGESAARTVDYLTEVIRACS